MKKGIITLLVLFGIMSFGLFGYSLMQIIPKEKRSGGYSKYYTSIRLKEGDTL